MKRSRATNSGRPVGALSHLRVLDLSRVLAGPWATQILGDLGAEVIKVERPDGGDDTRGWGPPWLAGPDGATGESAYHLSANRNKKSVTIDIATADGQALVRELALGADIVVENFKVGGLARYGLDHAGLAALNPRVIYCSITGFGQTGPYADRAGYDILLQAMGGLMSITGAPAGTPGGGPQKVGVAVIDIMTGLYATIGILAALAARERTGMGQHVDMALLDVGVASLANQAMGYLVTGRSPAAMGNAHPSIVPYQDFPTADGAMIVAVGNDGQYRRFCGALGLGVLGSDPRLATNAGRVAHREELVAAITAVTATRPTRHWIAALEAATVPCGPINAIADVFADPQVVARGMRRDLDHPSGLAVPTVASPLRLSATPVDAHSSPPMLGQHNAEIIGGLLGRSDAELARLKREGVI